MKKIICLMSAAALILLLLSSCGIKSSDSSDPPMPDAVSSADEITALTCSDGAVTMRFERDEAGAWHWLDDTGFPLDDAPLLSAIEALPDMKGRSIAEDALEDYGLAAPKSYLTVTAGEKSVTYYIGSTLKDGERYLNAQEDVTTIYPLPEAVSLLMSLSIYDLARLPQLPELSADNMQDVTIARGDSVLSLTISDGRWLCDGRDVTDDAAPLADALSQLTFSRCVDYAPSNGAAVICGLNAPAAAVTVHYTNHVGSISELTLAIGKSYQDGYFSAMGDDTTIYQLSDELAAPILALAENGI